VNTSKKERVNLFLSKLVDIYSITVFRSSSGKHHFYPDSNIYRIIQYSSSPHCIRSVTNARWWFTLRCITGGPKTCIRFIIAVISYQINPSFWFAGKLYL